MCLSLLRILQFSSRTHNQEWKKSYDLRTALLQVVLSECALRILVVSKNWRTLLNSKKFASMPNTVISKLLLDFPKIQYFLFILMHCKLQCNKLCVEGLFGDQIRLRHVITCHAMFLKNVVQAYSFLSALSLWLRKSAKFVPIKWLTTHTKIWNSNLLTHLAWRRSVQSKQWKASSVP